MANSTCRWAHRVTCVRKIRIGTRSSPASTPTVRVTRCSRVVFATAWASTGTPAPASYGSTTMAATTWETICRPANSITRPRPGCISAFLIATRATPPTLNSAGVHVRSSRRRHSCKAGMWPRTVYGSIPEKCSPRNIGARSSSLSMEVGIGAGRTAIVSSWRR